MTSGCTLMLALEDPASCLVLRKKKSVESSEPTLLPGISINFSPSLSKVPCSSPDMKTSCSTATLMVLNICSNKIRSTMMCPWIPETNQSNALDMSTSSKLGCSSRVRACKPSKMKSKDLWTTPSIWENCVTSTKTSNCSMMSNSFRSASTIFLLPCKVRRELKNGGRSWTLCPPPSREEWLNKEPPWLATNNMPSTSTSSE
mmetsp:Transcript_14804/g.16391  ORF Transcript_14804/g.16391 Transcript_14804/m.16391 type:complete len:202 (-) Transcript_14804:412-1017(-)